MVILIKFKHASAVWALCCASTCTVEYIFQVVVISKWLWLVDAACHGDCLWKSALVTIWSTSWVYALGWLLCIDMAISPISRLSCLTGDISRIVFDFIIEFPVGFLVRISVRCIPVSFGLVCTGWLLDCSKTSWSTSQSVSLDASQWVFGLLVRRNVLTLLSPSFEVHCSVHDIDSNWMLIAIMVW